MTKIENILSSPFQKQRGRAPSNSVKRVSLLQPENYSSTSSIPQNHLQICSEDHKGEKFTILQSPPHHGNKIRRIRFHMTLLVQLWKQIITDWSSQLQSMSSSQGFCVLWDSFKILSEIRYLLVGGWTNPSEKYARQNGNLPQIGAKIKHIWNILKPPPSLILSMVVKWYILPIGGLYATYHLLGEPETTT